MVMDRHLQDPVLPKEPDEFELIFVMAQLGHRTSVIAKASPWGAAER